MHFAQNQKKHLTLDLALQEFTFEPYWAVYKP